MVGDQSTQGDGGSLAEPVDSLESQRLGQFSMRRPSFWHEIRASLVTAQLPIDRPATLLDIGAGGGLLGDIVKRDRPRTTYQFVEPLDSIADRLESLFGKGSRVDDLADFDLSGVDVFSLLDVVEHIEDDYGFLRGVVERSRPGATLVLTVPAMPVLWSSWDEQLGHYRRYTRRTASALMRAMPFDRVEVAYLFPELVPAGLVRRFQRGRGAGSASDTEFPQLPSGVDRFLLGFSRLTTRARRWWPIGTSVVMISTRRG